MPLTEDDPKVTLRRANRLAREERTADAIELLTSANRRHRRFAFEKRLVQLRHDAFATMEVGAGRPSWPPAYVDTFPGETGAPDITADRLTTATLAGGILHHGCLIVRGLLQPGRAEEIAADIDRAFDASAAGLAGAPGRDTAPWYAPFSRGPGDPLTLGRGFANSTGGVWAADSPRIMFDLIDEFTRIGLGPILGEYFDEPPMLSVMKWTLRRVPVLPGADWHQDGAFLGDSIRTVNLWLALSACGVDSPGLDLVPRRIPNIVETGTGGAHFDWSVGDDIVTLAADGTAPVRPVFGPGDGIFFDERFLHRTGVSPSMSEPRFAVESWFFAPSAYPVDQVPIVF